MGSKSCHTWTNPPRAGKEHIIISLSASSLPLFHTSQIDSEPQEHSGANPPVATLNANANAKNENVDVTQEGGAVVSGVALASSLRVGILFPISFFLFRFLHLYCIYTWGTVTGLFCDIQYYWPKCAFPRLTKRIRLKRLHYCVCASLTFFGRKVVLFCTLHLFWMYTDTYVPHIIVIIILIFIFVLLEEYLWMNTVYVYPE